MEKLPINRLEKGTYTPETPKDHREELKKMIVAFEEAPAAEAAPATGPERLFAGLVNELHAKYAGRTDIPPFAQFLLNREPELFLKSLHFMDDVAVADLPPDATLLVDDRAQLVLRQAAGTTILMRWRAAGPEIAGFYQGPMRARES